MFTKIKMIIPAIPIKKPDPLVGIHIIPPTASYYLHLIPLKWISDIRGEVWLMQPHQDLPMAESSGISSGCWVFTAGPNPIYKKDILGSSVAGVHGLDQDEFWLLRHPAGFHSFTFGHVHLQWHITSYIDIFAKLWWTNPSIQIFMVCMYCNAKQCNVMLCHVMSCNAPQCGVG